MDFKNGMNFVAVSCGTMEEVARHLNRIAREEGVGYMEIDSTHNTQEVKSLIVKVVYDDQNLR